MHDHAWNTEMHETQDICLSPLVRRVPVCMYVYMWVYILVVKCTRVRPHIHIQVHLHVNLLFHTYTRFIGALCCVGQGLLGVLTVGLLQSLLTLGLRARLSKSAHQLVSLHNSSESRLAQKQDLQNLRGLRCAHTENYLEF